MMKFNPTSASIRRAQLVLVMDCSEWLAYVNNSDGTETPLGGCSSLPQAVKAADEAFLAGKCEFVTHWRSSTDCVALPIAGPRRYASPSPPPNKQAISRDQERRKNAF